MTPPLTSLPAVLPPLAGGNFLRTYLDPVPIALVLVGCGLYAAGVVRQNRLHPRHRWPLGRSAAAAGSAVTILVAISSFLGVYDQTLFWIHMVQHLLLIMVAAILAAAASPLALAWRATDGAVHRWLTAGLRSRAARIAGHPATAFICYGVLVPLTHLTVFVDWAVENRAVDELEHFLFFVVGYLFWRQIFGADPNRYRVQPPLRALLLFLALPVDTFVGLTLDQEKHEIFAPLAAEHRHWGPSLVMDLHYGGVLMWVGGDVLMMVALIPVVMAWMRREERSASRFDRELEAYFPPIGGGQPTAGLALGRYAPSEPERPGTVGKG